MDVVDRLFIIVGSGGAPLCCTQVGKEARQLPRIGHPILGYVIPAVIFIVSFLGAFLPYRKFTREMEESDQSRR